MKRNLLVALALVVILFTVGCVATGYYKDSTVQSDESNGFTIIDIASGGYSAPAIFIITDEKTDIQYIVVEGGNGLAITPRLNKILRPIQSRPRARVVEWQTR